jgi:uncharacterized RDD family membrane protein YckC
LFNFVRFEPPNRQPRFLAPLTISVVHLPVYIDPYYAVFLAIALLKSVFLAIALLKFAAFQSVELGEQQAELIDV